MKEVTISPSYTTYLAILKLSETNKEEAIKLLQLFLDTIGERIAEQIDKAKKLNHVIFTREKPEL